MDAPTRAMLDAIAARQGETRQTLRSWIEIESSSELPDGVRAQRDAVVSLLKPLADAVEWVDLPDRTFVDAAGEVRHTRSVEAAVLRKRPDAATKVLLAVHADTVFPPDTPFKGVEERGDRWIGPGVSDMKGGIAVMCEALRAFEQHSDAAKLGWTVVVTPDEEIGSPGAASLLRELAPGHAAGLVFETAADEAGNVAGGRGGSAFYDLVIRGRSAHVGRNFADGRSAMHVAGEVVGVLNQLNAAEGVTVNVGKIDGGGPSNQVAELAVVRFNVRVANAERQEGIENDLRRLVFVLGRRDGISAELHGGFTHPPKTPPIELLQRVKACGELIGLDIGWFDVGGVTDGNILQAAGLPTVDSLGVRGGGLHTHDEFAMLDSLVERAQLAALVLHSFAVNR